MSSNNDLSLCVAVLAAGRSQRFGNADKLAQSLNGKMLGLHICDALAPLNCAQTAVISSTADHSCNEGWRAKGFDVVVNEQAEDGLGTSVACAAQFAADQRVDALLICLADMPFVPTNHFQRLINALDPENGRTVVASSNGQSRSPPVLFGSAHFAELAELDGESGARILLATAHIIETEPQFLADIDTREQLAQASTLTR